MGDITKKKYDQRNNLVFTPPTHWFQIILMVVTVLYGFAMFLLFLGYRFVLNETGAGWTEGLHHAVSNAFSNKMTFVITFAVIALFISTMKHGRFLMCDGESIYFAGERWFPLHRISRIIINEDQKGNAKSITAVTADNIKVRMDSILTVDQFIYDMKAKFPKETAHIDIQRKKNIFTYSSVQLLIAAVSFYALFVLTLLTAHYLPEIF